jgi:hypothetical protein
MRLPHQSGMALTRAARKLSKQQRTQASNRTGALPARRVAAYRDDYPSGDACVISNNEYMNARASCAAIRGDNQQAEREVACR